LEHHHDHNHGEGEGDEEKNLDGSQNGSNTGQQDSKAELMAIFKTDEKDEHV
tara:strand:- start:560 stop:715 length:156 start_codon:yes stop_codon:yes gene_type:complete